MPSPARNILSDRKAARQHYNDVFQEFAKAYPRHIDQSAAFNVFLDLMEEGVDPQMLIEKARSYARNTDPKDMRWVPSPRNWLRDRRYEDTDLFTDQFTSVREFFEGAYDRADAAAVCHRYGFIYVPPPAPEGVDPDRWREDQRRLWIGQIADHVLNGKPLPE
ncbi:hypothetical protein MINTM005_13820 [Mycobacterium intracellulare]|uniref:hypothetical protein n=1 Tax=Mycobacterium intracellulare TaxID=1767 RepID=UPI001927FAFF|nr:hypothetical protein [Mycobacterium intracellulare]BCO56138.1 hypothetical protein MINTM005_13820 [Mycobacterium intracellulare]